MSKPTLGIAALLLAGCASMGEWRTLSIDGSTESAFNESIARMDQALPYTRRQMFALALVDIARTGMQGAEQTQDGVEDAYANEDFRNQLDGLTYEGVIALADETGTPIWTQYYAGRRMPAIRGGFSQSNQPEPFFATDGDGPAPNAWTTGWPSNGISNNDTVAIQPDSW